MANLSTNAAVNRIAELLGAAEEMNTNGALNLILTAIQAAGGGGYTPSYKFYVANFSQTDTSTPSMTVYDSTLDESVVASRITAGRYRLTCAEFSTGQVWIAGCNTGGGDGSIRIPIVYDGTTVANILIAHITGSSIINVTIFQEGTNTMIDLSTTSMNSFDFPEIRVYPA